jgi:hypothetical protein
MRICAGGMAGMAGMRRDDQDDRDDRRDDDFAGSDSKISQHPAELTEKYLNCPSCLDTISI